MKMAIEIACCLHQHVKCGMATNCSRNYPQCGGGCQHCFVLGVGVVCPMGDGCRTKMCPEDGRGDGELATRGLVKVTLSSFGE